MDVRLLPKIDLHLHLDGAIRTKTIVELAEEMGVHLPARDPRTLGRYVTVSPRCRSLSQFLKTFEVIYPILRRAKSLERIAYELCETKAVENCLYFEVRYAPCLNIRNGFTLEDSVASTLAGLEHGRKTFGVEYGLILCLFRAMAPRYAIETVRVAARYRDRGVVGIDIAGDEKHSDLPFEPAFMLARRHGLPITIHAGEAGPASNVRQAIERFGAVRIGHGCRVIDDPDLVRLIRHKKVTLEICLTSNVQTRAVRSLREHPFRQLYSAGVRLTLNTDDPAISRIDLNHEYALAARTFGLRREDFHRLVETAADASFAPPNLKRRLRHRIHSAFAKE